MVNFPRACAAAFGDALVDALSTVSAEPSLRQIGVQGLGLSFLGFHRFVCWASRQIRPVGGEHVDAYFEHLGD